MAITQPKARRGSTRTVLPQQRPTVGGRAAQPVASPAEPATTELRDRLTRTHLRAAPESPAPGDVLAFRPRWWDGAARVPAVVLRLPDGDRRSRCRLVETGGRVVALPSSSWRARRTLRRIRRPVRAGRSTSTAARADALWTQARRGRMDVARTAGTRRLVLVEQAGDAMRCSRPDCAGLVLVLPPGRLASSPACCSRCGAAAT